MIFYKYASIKGVKMKAVQIEKYSHNIKAVVKNIDTPAVNDDDILIKVISAAVNPLDLLIMKGNIKLIQNYKMPLTLGCECAGIVEKTGRNVKNFKAGDKVYTRLPQNKIGAFAEYVAVDEKYAAKMPENCGFNEAAAVPIAALTIYQALTEELLLKENGTLLITGGSGSFGQIAVPFAKLFNQNVIVTGSKRAENHILSLGADKFIDYKKEQYWETLSDIDYVIDTTNSKDFTHSFSVLKKGGTLISLKGIPNKEFAEKNHFSFAKKMLFSLAGVKYDKEAAKQHKKYKFLFVRADGTQLQKITEIIEKNNIKPVIHENIFKLEQINDALNLLANGHINGKIVINI